MKVTVCELSQAPGVFDREWTALCRHVNEAGSELVLLPEMPFSPWVTAADQVDREVWRQAVRAHDQWLERLHDLNGAAVAASRPVITGGKSFNEGFFWTAVTGARTVHTKYYLPEEPGFWEARWYDRRNCRFEPFRWGDWRLGMMICTDLWFVQHARAFGQAGVDVILHPRATEKASLDKWVVGGQAAAVVAGAYLLSSNHTDGREDGDDLGGRGFVVDPDGTLLGRTSAEEPFLTVVIDRERAAAAKKTYPRYVKE